MGGRALRCSGEETGCLVLKLDLRMTPELQQGGCRPCQPATRCLWRRQGHPEAGSVPQKSLLVWERCGLGRLKGSRRCTAAGERVSVAAVAYYGECWTLGLNVQDCLLCSPANTTNTIMRKKSPSITVSTFGRRDRVQLVFFPFRSQRLKLVLKCVLHPVVLLPVCVRPVHVLR